MRDAAWIDVLEPRRLLASDPIDRSFSSDGLLTTSINGGYNNLHAVAVQADGKVIVAGEAHPSTGTSAYGFVAIRYNVDGTLDDGSVNDSTPGDAFGAGGKFFYLQGTFSTVNDIAIQRNGKIILAGTANSGGSLNQQYWLMLRLNTNGSIDKTFGSDGVGGVQFGIESTPLNDIALQSDGKIVVVGALGGDYLISRFTTSGETDYDFGEFGQVTLDWGGTDVASDVALDHLGNLVVAGGAAGNGVAQKIGVVRLRTDGSLDENFAAGGKYLHNTQSSSVVPAGLATLADGTINFIYSEYYSGGWNGNSQNLRQDGTPTSSSGGGPAKYNALAVMPNGQLARTNELLSFQNASESKISVALNGSYYAMVTAFGNKATSTAIAAAPDGSLYVGGYVDKSGGRDFLLVKYVGVDPLSWGSLRGSIFRDSDGDRVRDADESGLLNVRVYADSDNDGKFSGNEPSALTDAAGNYTLLNLTPGTVVVRQVKPPAYTQLIPASAYSFTIIGGKAVSGGVFANKPAIVASTQTAITGNVFNDYNNNALRETTGTIEPDMKSVVVFLDGNRNGKLDTAETYTKTDASGNYTLALPKAGTWRVVVSPPRGFTGSAPIFRDVRVQTRTQGVVRFALTPIDADDTLAEAAPITLGRAVSGTIANATDVNIYSFTAKAGQTILFDLDLGKASQLNSYLRVLDSRGNVLAANDNAAAAGEVISLDSYIRYRFAKSGTYYIAVSNQVNSKYSPLTGKDDLGGGSIGAYSLLARALA